MKNEFYLGRMMNLFYAVSVILPLLIISLFAMNYSRTFLIELSKDNNSQIASNLKLNLESFFTEPESDLKLLASLILNNDNMENAEQTINTFDKTQKNFSHYTIIDDEGIVIFNYPQDTNLIGFDYSSRQAYKAIKSGNTDYWSETSINSQYDSVFIDYSLPLGKNILIGTVYLDSLEEVFNRTISDNDLLVGITDETGVYILNTDYRLVEQRTTDPYINNRQLEYEKVRYLNEDYFGTSISSEYKGWNIIIYETVDNLNQRVNQFVLYLSGIILLLTGISIFLGRKLNAIVFRNLTNVIKKTKNVAAGEYALDNMEGTFIEFNEININFLHMAKKIEQREKEILKHKNEIELMNKELEERVIIRTNELYDANLELETTLNNLEETQEQLIESEKLASLGNLVTGLAHEINTPLGVVLTIITYLQDLSEKILDKLNDGTLRKSEFVNYLEKSQDSEKLIYDNINRANELVSSFKLVSSDQSSIETRKINLYEYIENIITTLNPQLKRFKILVHLDGDKDIEILTVPLSIYQTIVNIVINSKIHGYDNDEGDIYIHIIKLANSVNVTIEDHGKGIDKDNIKKIFEPFYTTTRGSGGTGLGLNIAYNTIKQNLKGKITCESTLGKGTKFIIELPYSVD